MAGAQIANVARRCFQSSTVSDMVWSGSGRMEDANGSAQHTCDRTVDGDHNDDACTNAINYDDRACASAITKFETSFSEKWRDAVDQFRGDAQVNCPAHKSGTITVLNLTHSGCGFVFVYSVLIH